VITGGAGNGLQRGFAAVSFSARLSRHIMYFTTPHATKKTLEMVLAIAPNEIRAGTHMPALIAMRYGR